MADVTVIVIGVDVASVNMEIIHNVTVIVHRCAKYTAMYMHTICHAYRIIVDNLYTMHTLYWMTANGNYCIDTASMESWLFVLFWLPKLIVYGHVLQIDCVHDAVLSLPYHLYNYCTIGH